MRGAQFEHNRIGHVEHVARHGEVRERAETRGEHTHPHVQYRLALHHAVSVLNLQVDHTQVRTTRLFVVVVVVVVVVVNK